MSARMTTGEGRLHARHSASANACRLIHGPDMTKIFYLGARSERLCRCKANHIPDHNHVMRTFQCRGGLDGNPDQAWKKHSMHRCLGALTNNKLPGYIVSERTILLLLVCVTPSILSKFSVGMGAMSAPGNNCVIVSTGKALRGVGPSWLC